MKKCVCGNEMTPADWKNQWVCHRCGRTKPIFTTATNADRIRSMTDEDLAKELAMIAEWDRKELAKAKRGPGLLEFMKDWLQHPEEGRE